MDNLKTGINDIREHIINLNSSIEKMKENTSILENKVSVLEEKKLCSDLKHVTTDSNFSLNEEFVNSLNNLSNLIHMLMKNIRSGLNNAKTSSESVIFIVNKIDIR